MVVNHFIISSSCKCTFAGVRVAVDVDGRRKGMVGGFSSGSFFGVVILLVPEAGPDLACEKNK